jgi:hypothetical protein
MGRGARLASSYIKKWACNTQEPVRLTFPENVATNFCQKWNSQARSGLHLLQIFPNTSVLPSLALSIQYGYSHASRYRQEVQSVPIPKGKLTAFDWTFAPVANYILTGSKAMFTGMKGLAREWICGKIVESTGVDQVSHLLIELKQKMEENDPSVLYRDTCPHKAPFYKRIYGANLVTRLDLFHLIAQDSGHVRCTFNGVLEGACKTQGLLLYSQGSQSEPSHWMPDGWHFL